ncbi:hypothetical protein GQ44DRAFT_780855 [Phaeosphaeriaceae sp. PMI808]|nr:hypothetical protein GQ44DRAFT_780855 [Phaeosphaeriaceae sp. PMI808]
MSETASSKTFLAADGKWYTTDRKYVLENDVWVTHQSAGVSNTSGQQNQPTRAQSEPSLEPVPGDDMSAAIYGQFGLSPPSQPQLPRQPATNSFQPTGIPASPEMDVDPSFRTAKDRHIMVGAFVEALDAIYGRKG